MRRQASVEIKINPRIDREVDCVRELVRVGHVVAVTLTHDAPAESDYHLCAERGSLTRLPIDDGRHRVTVPRTLAGATHIWKDDVLVHA